MNFNVVARRASSLLLPRRQLGAMRRAFSAPVVELREYNLKVRHAGAFYKAAEEMAQVRRTMLPLRFYCRPETGACVER